MATLKHLLLILLNLFVLTSSNKILKCKYILIEKTYYAKQQATLVDENNSTSIGLMYLKQFNFGTGKIELLKSHLFRWHLDNCLNKSILDRIDVVNNQFRSNADSSGGGGGVADKVFSLFGVDLSANDLSDAELETIFNVNPIFKYNLNLIRYLNLAGNALTRVSSSATNRFNEFDEFSYLNDGPILKPNQTGYLLATFFNLDTLILDDNPQLSLNIPDLMAVLPKLKVL